MKPEWPDKPIGQASRCSHARLAETESALQAQRLAEQSWLLTAAGRMAKGDLVSQITVPNGSELSPLALALDSMRQDLQQRLQQLEQRNVEIRGLNVELGDRSNSAPNNSWKQSIGQASSGRTERDLRTPLLRK